jgi:hypothetical protein
LTDSAGERKDFEDPDGGEFAEGVLGYLARHGREFIFMRQSHGFV